MYARMTRRFVFVVHAILLDSHALDMRSGSPDRRTVRSITIGCCPRRLRSARRLAVWKPLDLAQTERRPADRRISINLVWYGNVGPLRDGWPVHPSAFCLLPAAYCLLPAACRLLPVARCPLPAAISDSSLLHAIHGIPHLNFSLSIGCL